MPKADFGQKTALDRGGKFVELKALNEKLRFQIIAGAVYDGKHFEKMPDGSWNITFCPRIMREEPCNFCDNYFELRRKIKVMKEEKQPTAEINKVQDESRKFAPTVTFYYPIINRESEEAQILKTKLSVRTKLEEFFENGLKVIGCDFILTRTEKPGSDYYSLIRVDSSETKPLTEKENKELETAKDWDLEEMVGIAKESSQQFKDDENVPSSSPVVEEPEEDTREVKAAPSSYADLPQEGDDDIPF